MLQKVIKKVRRKMGMSDPYMASPDVIEQFSAILENPFLVSFPRTGSHWLRMMMELYFQRPFLVRTFYFPKQGNYLALHTHDLDLDVFRSNVIYLYRDPVPTIYSQLCFHNHPLDSEEWIRHWSDLYGRHLEKWLCNDTFTQRKTIIRYELLRSQLEDEFQKICAHFGVVLDPDLLQSTASQVSKEKVKEKTTHDQRVIKLSRDYGDERSWFSEVYGAYVRQIIFQERKQLEMYF